MEQMNKQRPPVLLDYDCDYLKLENVRRIIHYSIHLSNGVDRDMNI
jgi:hypothetical protein